MSLNPWPALFIYPPLGSPHGIPRRPRHGLPDSRSDGPTSLLRQAPAPAPPRRLGLPPLRRRSQPVHHPPPPRELPSHRLPVQDLPPGVQPVHRPPLAGDPPYPRRDPADPARVRPR